MIRFADFVKDPKADYNKIPEQYKYLMIRDRLRYEDEEIHEMGSMQFEEALFYSAITFNALYKKQKKKKQGTENGDYLSFDQEEDYDVDYPSLERDRDFVSDVNYKEEKTK